MHCKDPTLQINLKLVVDFAEVLQHVLCRNSNKILTVPSSLNLSEKGIHVFKIKHWRTFLLHKEFSEEPRNTSLQFFGLKIPAVCFVLEKKKKKSHENDEAIASSSAGLQK